MLIVLAVPLPELALSVKRRLQAGPVAPMNSVGDVSSECYVKCQRDLSGHVEMIRGCMHLTACACVFTREQEGTTYVAVFVHMNGYRYTCLFMCASVPIPLTACLCVHVSMCLCTQKVHRRALL